MMRAFQGGPMVRFVLPLAAACVLSGCVTEEAAVSQAAVAPIQSSAAGWCAAAGEFLRDPYATDWEKLAIYDKMTNRGCMK